jgi:peptidoglycan/xylan/chitin deacetylase (PgdA/CDA1 family)|tara:strand:- start:39 stop:965 length:927 start_codon:yes stop_codon:yes gene_type:complete
MKKLTIIMYHYVRPIAESDFPNIKGLELDGFIRQLDFLQENFHIVSSEEVLNCVLKGANLPEKACWLTFDDGYKDHHDYVLPELMNRNLSGAFFPPKVAIQDSVILDVNATHYILAKTNNIQELVHDLKVLCLENGFSQKQIKELYMANATENRFDDKDTIYVKRMLQHALPEGIRNNFTSFLFEKYVGLPENEFAKNIYMNDEEIKKLIKCGMYVGSHGSMHYWLNRISPEKQKHDIVSSLDFLEEVGAPTSDWIMCYPYGAYNDDTLSILKQYGAAIGLTTEIRKAEVSKDNPLTLPRLDTNDFPQ